MITFGGSPIPSFVRVNNISYSILPPVESKTKKVQGRPGTYDFGIELGQREINVDIQIIADNHADILNKTRALAIWLYHENLQPFILDSEPDKQYMARFTGTSEISEIVRVGAGSLQFICPDAYAESITTKVVVEPNPSTTIPIAVVNEGSGDAYPLIELAITQDTTDITVVSGDKFIRLGDDRVSVTKTIVDPNPIIFTDDFSAFSGWTAGVAIDDGLPYGSFISNGDVAYQSGKDYGPALPGGGPMYGWRGATAVRALSKQLDNFTVEAGVRLWSETPEQIGRIQVYLLDQDNVIFGRISLRDTDPNMEKPIFEARAGAFGNGVTFTETYGDYKGVFGQFMGMYRISRRGNVWSTYITKIDQTTGVHHTGHYKEWKDVNNQFPNKLAKIQIHIGALDDYVPVNTLSFADIKVIEHDGVVVDPGIHSPIAFKQGDIVTIDNNKAIVLKNGEPIFHELSPSSDFFSLKSGANGLMVSPPVADVTISYKERWL